MILVVNAGSTSLKAELFAPDLTSVLSLEIGGIGGAATLTVGDATTGVDVPDPPAAVALLPRTLEARGHPPASLSTAAHRVVHGGALSAPARTDAAILAAIEAAIPLAPLHNPANLAPIRALAAAAPDLPQVASFDTAFHATCPEVATTYALPADLRAQGIRRYGFHGLACQSICTTLRAEGFPLDTTRLAIAHLGNGCSVTAVENGRSKATSMGFSVLDGLTMGTRCGALDPGVILHLLRTGHSAEEIETLLYHRSGLLGLSGLSSDMRDLTASDRPEATDAVSHFVARVVGEVCRAAGAMGGLDVLVFSGGIGENAAPIRTAIMQGLAFLPGRDGSGVETMVRAAREEDVLLRAAAQVSKGR